MTDTGAQALLDEITAKRGYTLEMHRILAEADPVLLRGYEGLLDAAYVRERALDRRTKELIYVAVLTALSAPREQVVAHIRAALTAGATPDELLQVLEQILPPVGVPRFIEGLEAWHAVTVEHDGDGTAPTPESSSNPGEG